MRRNSSIDDTLVAWQEKLKFIKLSHEVLGDSPACAPFAAVLYNVAKGAGRDYLKEFYNCLITHGSNIVEFLKSDKDTFVKLCAFQLQGLSEQEIADIYKGIPNDCFVLSKHEYLQKIKRIVDEYKSNLAKLQLRKLWKEKTGAEHPYAWSTTHKTPILACIQSSKWNEYKRAFDAVNRQNPEDSEVKFALEFLTANPIWDDITDQQKIDAAFIKAILSNLKSVLTDLNEVREYLFKHAHSITPYDWGDHAEITRLVKELAQNKYSKEPYERVMRRIDSMGGNELKDYLKHLVKDNMVVGIEILEASEEG